MPAALLAATGLHFLLLAPPPCRAETPTSAVETAHAAAGDPPAIAELIRKLDDDRFAVREAAHQRLFALGSSALNEVGRTAATGSLESSTRAVSILLQWSQSIDDRLSMGALEQLAALTNRPAESAMAADRLADVRERAAMEAIVELGGRVEYDRQVAVFSGTTPPIQVVIGPNWTGGEQGLSHIAAVRRASTVSFYSAAITGDEAADAVSKLTQVQRIEFYGTKISEEALAKLHATLPPGTAVDVRGGARLGIAGATLVGGAGVGAVDPGTAAEKAGLIPGDVITEIEGVTVADFEALTREIAKCQAGDSITLKVLRQSPVGQPQATPITITVTFARWGDEPAVNPMAPNPLGGPPLGAQKRVFITRPNLR